MERFIRYLRGSLWVPLASRMAAEGVVVDRTAANLAAARWLREVANVRVHATTGEVPAERLAQERAALRPVPPPYAGRLLRADAAPPARAVRPIVGLQHPLAVYDALAPLAAVSAAPAPAAPWVEAAA